jgi:hypothetical protein
MFVGELPEDMLQELDIEEQKIRWHQFNCSESQKAQH